MFFLNLSLGEFLAIAGTLSAVITALYFFDRSKRKKTVSTLRFWTGALGAEQEKHRKSVRQPWSLLLQLVSVLLLLLALARLQWGSRSAEFRNTVLLLDVSSAVSRKAGNTSILDREKELARQYLAQTNSRERVMLVRVNALASPATPFTTDRGELRNQVNATTATYSALNVERALQYARQATSWAAGLSGEVVYIGPGRTTERFSGSTPGLRVVPVPGGTENVGIRNVTVSRAEGEEAWRAAVTLKNDGRQGRVLTLSARFGSTPFTRRRITLRPQQEVVASYQFVASTAGRLVMHLDPSDSLPADDEASVMVPANKPARVVVYSTRAEAWRPLLNADTALQVTYRPTEQYAAHPDADVVVLDRFAPRSRPQVPSLWVDPPAAGSPVPVESDAVDQTITQWNTDDELGAGLHARDVVLPRAKVFQAFDKDYMVASIRKGPVAVVRPASDSGDKLAAVGFDFIGEPLRYKVTTPLLFANLMRWLAPQAFRAVQVSAEPVGLADVTLDDSERMEDVRVADESGRAMPFLSRDRRLQFFVEAPTVAHVVTGQRERILSLVLPEVATQEWKIPAAVPRGLPGPSGGGAAAVDLWKMLACLGGLGFLLEWILFGRQRAIKLRPSSAAPVVRGGSPREQRERELVGR
jgi:Aerotolerance regulator N-terminal/von Willebrand factor type A domain